MKVIIQLFRFKSRLGRKGAIIDIDIIIAYLLFMGLIITIVQFTLGLVTVFSNDFRTLSREKNVLSASELINTKFMASDINDLCNELNYSNVRVKYIEYDLLGFFMPKKDSNYSLPNTGGQPELLFLRDDNYLRIIIGSDNSTDMRVNVYASMDYETTVLNKSLESNDNLSLYFDTQGFFVVNIESVVSNGDLDEVLIGPINERTLIIPEFYNINESNVYVGNLRFNDGCGRVAIKGPQSSFTRYGTITHDEESYPIRINGDLWWTG